MRKSATVGVVIAAVFGLWINAAMIGHGQGGQQRVKWEYGVFDETKIGQSTFFHFLTTTSKTGSGQTLEEFLTKYAGTTPARATYSDVWSALGADGWELVQVVDTRGSSPATTDYYFKRMAN